MQKTWQNACDDMLEENNLKEERFILAGLQFWGLQSMVSHSMFYACGETEMPCKGRMHTIWKPGNREKGQGTRDKSHCSRYGPHNLLPPTRPHLLTAHSVVTWINLVMRFLLLWSSLLSKVPLLIIWACWGTFLIQNMAFSMTFIL